MFLYILPLKGSLAGTIYLVVDVLSAIVWGRVRFDSEILCNIAFIEVQQDVKLLGVFIPLNFCYESKVDIF